MPARMQTTVQGFLPVSRPCRYPVPAGECDVSGPHPSGEIMNEEVLWSGRPAMFRSRPVGFVLACAAVPLVVGAVVLLVWYLQCRSTRLTVTERRVSLQEGLLSRSTNEIRLRDIRNIRTHQTLFQRMMGVGTLAVSSSAQDDIEIAVTGLPQPERLAALIRTRQG